MKWVNEKTCLTLSLAFRKIVWIFVFEKWALQLVKVSKCRRLLISSKC